MKINKLIKGVIFDFNGTLFWDTALHNLAWDTFLEKHGIYLSDREKNEIIHGKNNKDILNLLFNNQLLQSEIADLSLEKEMIYQKLCIETEMKLAPGADEFLTYLTLIKIPFTIATASEPYNVDFYFEQLNLRSFFDRSKVVCNDGTIMSKPHPQIFQKEMEILGTAPSETLVFEDSFSGILAAENAGVAGIIIADSDNNDYSRWDYQIIKDFGEVNSNLFDQ